MRRIVRAVKLPGGSIIATVAVCAAMLVPASANAVTFTTPSYVGVWGDPFAIATPDLNGDGYPDLVAGIAGQVGPEVVTLFGNGQGAFTHEQQYELQGNAAFGIAVADLDGDGKLDVAAALDGEKSKAVGVLHGEGKGSFNLGPSYFAAEEGALTIAAGRFTGKALPDLVVGNSNSENVTLLENHSKPGTLSFSAPKAFAAGHTPSAMAVADFNRDGVPDAVVSDDDEGGLSGYTILEGSGTPSGFKSESFTPLGFSLVDVRAATSTATATPISHSSATNGSPPKMLSTCYSTTNTAASKPRPPTTPAASR